MSETPGRGYLPPTVPAPGAHRRQWQPLSYYPPQWPAPPPKTFMVPAPPSPQSEGMDLSARSELNGGEINGASSVSVIAPNPLLAEEKPVIKDKVPLESPRVFEPKPEPFEDPFVSKELDPSIPTEEKAAAHPTGSKTPPQPAAQDELSLDVPVEAEVPLSEGAAVPTEGRGAEADHVESLLENMFQGEAKQSVIVANCSRTPVLTEDKVVEILEDSVKEEPEEPKENQFMEVESELEKMFAGIEEEKPVVKTEVAAPPPPTGEISSKKVKRKSKPKPRKSTDSVVESRKKKAKSRERSGQRPKKQKREKENSNDSLSVGGRSMRCPYVHVEGRREAPDYVSVVNSGGREEEERERGVERRTRQTITEGRAKSSNLYSSTLSSRYNAQSADPSWVCVFCKRRAHCEGGLGGEAAGDLFGPYILTLAKKEDVDSGLPGDREVSAEQKRRGGGRAVSLRATGSIDAFINNFAKKPKKSGGGSGGGEDCSGEREVWVHEKCAVWAPGVYLAGPYLIGLAEAVPAAANTKCSYCGENGACIGCVQRGCSFRGHYGCCLTSDWRLDHETFMSHCALHAANKMVPRSKKAT